MDTPRGIEGLKGREPIAAALTVGKKGQNGAPTEKDRFHVLESATVQREFQKNAGGTYAAPVRDPHPSFTAFNSAPPDRRKVIHARLAHVSIAECFEFRLQCGKTEAWTNTKGQQVRPIPAHPKKGPSCIGNGKVAQRWNGTEYVQIACPGEACEFSVAGPIDNYTKRPKKAPCGPWMRLIARFEFPPTAVKLPDGTEKVVRLPNLPFKFTSGGWNTVREFVGFFDAFERACRGFGVDPASVPLFGMPIVLTLSERVNVEAKSRFPVVSIAMGGDADLIAWIQRQLEQRVEIRRLAEVAPLPALTDRSQQDAAVIDADFETISAPSIPAAPQGDRRAA